MEKVAYEIASRLAGTSGQKNVWVASASEDPSLIASDTLVPVPVDAWNVFESRIGVPWPIWGWRGLRKLYGLVRSADIVHLHDALYFGNFFAWLFARWHRIPVILTQHIGTIPYRSRFLRCLHFIANRTVGRLIASSADRVVFISSAVCDEFSRFCSFRSPPLYIPNGVEHSVFCRQGACPDHQKIRDVRANGGRVFIFVGRFVEKKGLHVLHRLAANCSTDLWIFAGHGPLDPEAWGLANVLVVRDERGPGLASYYRAADLLVLPSVGEGFPLVVQEAMACGTPALVGEETAAGCPQAAALLLVESLDAEGAAGRWTTRLQRIEPRSPAWLALREDVAKFALDFWSWDRAASRYRLLIDELLSAKRQDDEA